MAAQGDCAMSNSVVRARINRDIKDEASAVLKAMGVTVFDAFRLMMVKIAKEGSRLPKPSLRRGASETCTAGEYDLEEHLKDMELDGLASEVLDSSQGLFLL
jgi:DNA-damage-inducible protein J